ncbi:hypothetical protein C7T94_01055 [Pedobacter yulinensis]|uniref:TonB C-terminal domain-containing protein n=1 Tax=Pedobacter yulinensis TaxID=2126353 RepID=A0A2T3HQT4_9SPHI|nr:energy transducer TonB [Pedobacter yulinensis]PST84747.1 hypothetical protein C7T94_01055 [Pedobacter yulinensis]
MKKLIALGIGLYFAQPVFAQKKLVTYLKDGAETKNPAEADYRRVISETDQPGMFSVLEFYPDETPKTEGMVSRYEPNLIYEGLLKRYNKRGLPKSAVTYVHGVMLGTASMYHENGRLATVKVYGHQAPQPGMAGQSNVKLVHAFDSTGLQTVRDGSGNFKDGPEEGRYENGLKNGLWKGMQSGFHYEETYVNGQFKSGQVTLKNGKTQKYKSAEQPPGYEPGLPAFYQYMASRIKYPVEAQRAGITGRALVSFVVDTDGSLTDIRFRNRLGYGIEDEIRRVLSQAPSWEPGRLHGVPVRVSYNIQLRMSM